MKGEDPSTVEKTRTALRDLDTRMKVSIHSIEAIAKRIETLRDQELQPQLLELVQGYVLCYPSILNTRAENFLQSTFLYF